MLIKSQLYCLLILRPQTGARGEIRTPNLLALDQVPLLVGLREREILICLDAAIGFGRHCLPNLFGREREVEGTDVLQAVPKKSHEEAS